MYPVFNKYFEIIDFIIMAKNTPDTKANIIFTVTAPYDRLISSGNATEGDIILDKYGDGPGILHTHGHDFYFMEPNGMDGYV